MSDLKDKKAALIKEIKQTTTMKQIQAYDPEAHKQDITLEALLTGNAVNISIPGTINAYKNYQSQVRETYKKYNGQSDFGTQQVRAVVDLRTAFLSGEGVNVAAENEKTRDFIERFLFLNRLNGACLVNLVKGTEMSGHQVAVLQPHEFANSESNVRVRRYPLNIDLPIEPIYKDEFRDDIKAIGVKNKKGHVEELKLKNFIYIRTGGDDWSSYGATTKVGLVLTDIENYDRAIKDQRRINHITARVTPVFKVEDADGVKSLKAQLQDSKWKIGKTYIGSADFSYETPGQGAHENLNSELVATIKNISSVTGVPVHWLGYVDLMSNRSTAETLYELLKNATSNERLIWESSLYDMILKAQEVYVDSGLSQGFRIDSNFDVKLPLLDFSNFLERIRGYEIAFKNAIISDNDFRNAIPGIDPIKTKRDLELQQKEAEADLMRRSEDIDFENMEGTKNDQRNTEK